MRRGLKDEELKEEKESKSGGKREKKEKSTGDSPRKRGKSLTENESSAPNPDLTERHRKKT